MNRVKNNIDEMISKILSEEIEKKSKEMTEKLSKKQSKYLDVAEPKGKLTAADFKKLRSKKNSEVKESGHYDTNSEWYGNDVWGGKEDDFEVGDSEETSDFEEMKPKEKESFLGKLKSKILGKKETDEEVEEGNAFTGMLKKTKKGDKFKLGGKEYTDRSELDEFFFEDDDTEELSKNEPTYVGRGLKDNKIKADLKNKIYGSFSDIHGWYDNDDREFIGDFGNDYDEEEFEDFESFNKKYKNKQRWFSPGKEGEKFFNKYKETYGLPFRVRKLKLGSEEDNDMSSLAESKKWIQKTGMKKGSLHKNLGIPETEKLSKTLLNKLKKELMKKSEGDKKLSSSDLKKLKQVNLALTLKNIKENKNSLKLTENELIDMIESIVLEEKQNKDNIDKKESSGLKKTEKVLSKNKIQNDEYIDDLTKKLTDYLKKGSKGKFETKPKNFPKGNGELGEMDKKAYKPSQAVEEYIEAFAYPGQTNLRFNEIKPNEDDIKNYLQGSSKTGNAELDEDGNPLGNVVPSEVGERFMKNYKDNLYGAEQSQASYKRQSQPVDVAGEKTESGGLKGKTTSIKKATKILNQLESVDEKKLKKINEDMNKMKNLINYNNKTQ